MMYPDSAVLLRTLDIAWFSKDDNSRQLSLAAVHINIPPFDFVLCSMKKTITLVKVMVQEEVPDASALIILISRGGTSF
jgi:hypothetical protein